MNCAPTGRPHEEGEDWTPRIRRYKSKFSQSPKATEGVSVPNTLDRLLLPISADTREARVSNEFAANCDP